MYFRFGHFINTIYIMLSCCSVSMVASPSPLCVYRMSVYIYYMYCRRNICRNSKIGAVRKTHLCPASARA